VVAVGVEVVAELGLALVGAAVLVVTLGLVVLRVAPAPVVRPSVVLPVEHAATSDERTRATGRRARGRIRLGITRP
jgi:hypothetical protein